MKRKKRWAPGTYNQWAKKFFLLIINSPLYSEFVAQLVQLYTQQGKKCFDDHDIYVLIEACTPLYTHCVPMIKKMGYGYRVGDICIFYVNTVFTPTRLPH